MAETNAHRFVALNAEAAAIYKRLGAEFKNFDMISECPTTAATAFAEELIFFTVNLASRRSDLLVREIETPRGAVRAVRRTTPFHIDAWVILPVHMHCMWTLPEGDADFSGRWWDVKVRFSKSLPNVKSTRPEPPARDGRDIWQKRFWEHTIRDGLSRSHGLRAF